jgi:murein peptide amidase A
VSVFKPLLVGVLLLCASCSTVKTSWQLADQQTAKPDSKLIEPTIEAAPLAATPAPQAPAADTIEREKFCTELSAFFLRVRWGAKAPCDWIEESDIIGYSELGRPIFSWTAPGSEALQKTTLIQCGIHGDEHPSVPMCLRLIGEIKTGRRVPPKNMRVVVQPLLNPDGLFANPSTRPNSRGVDINRNFPTQDYATKSLESWKSKDKGDPRKFPGTAANSESETRAIVDFVTTLRPQKILSIHTPLGHLDLDAKGKADQERRARFLAINMSKNSGNYAFKSWGFFPGSLGNFAGRELEIPVYTLELPPGNNEQNTIDHYWKRFRKALWRAVDFDLDTGLFIEDE